MVLADTINDADPESDLEPTDESMPPDEQNDDESSLGIYRNESMRLFFLFGYLLFWLLCCIQIVLAVCVDVKAAE